MFKVSINRGNCISCGYCWTNCGEVFEPSEEDNHSQITAEHRVEDDVNKGKVPESIKCVKDAESNCPVSVISVEEE